VTEPVAAIQVDATAAPTPNERAPGIRAFALPAVLLLAAAWRLHGLDDQSIWYDEALSIGIGQTPFAQLIDSVKRFEQTPPLYHLLLSGWMRLFGDSEFAVRVPSVIAGVMACWATWRLAERAGGFVAACAATLLMVLSPFQLVYAQEARTYALLLALGLWSSEFLLRILDGSRVGGVLYVLVASAMLWTHPFSALVLLAHNLVVTFSLLRRPKPKVSIGLWLAIQGATALLFVPWLPTQLRWTQSVAKTFWIPPFGVGEILRAFWVYADSLPALILLTVFVIVGMRQAKDKRIPLLGAALTLACVILPVILSLIVRPLFTPRYGIVCTGAIYALAGAGVAALRPAWARGIAIAALVALPLIGSWPHPSYAGHEKDDWRGAGAYLQQSMRPGDYVAINVPNATMAYTYYVNRPDVELIAFAGPRIPLGVTSVRRGASVWLVVHAARETPEQIIAAGGWHVAEQPHFRGVHVYRLLPSSAPASGPKPNGEI